MVEVVDDSYLIKLIFFISVFIKTEEKKDPTSKIDRLFPREWREELLPVPGKSFHLKTPMTACRTQRRSLPSL